jgi:glycosyltransferase involved in cell wall biosynthesis
MTKGLAPVSIRYEITEGEGDLYLATVSLLSLRQFLENEIARVEVLIPDVDLAQDARATWMLAKHLGIHIVTELGDETAVPSSGPVISGAPVLLVRRPTAIVDGFRIFDGHRHVACHVAQNRGTGAPPEGMTALRPALGATTQVAQHVFPDVSIDAFALFQDTLRQFHQNGFFWDYRYRTNPGLGSGIGSRGIYQGIKREVLNRNVVAAGLSVVDIGCGDLEVCRYLSFKDYVGVDEAPEALALGRSKRPDWTFVKAPLDTSTGPVAEVAICFEVLIHAPSEDAASILLRTLASSASKRIIVSGYDHPIPKSSIVYFHAPLRDMLESLPGWEQPVRIARYENLSVYVMDRAGANLPAPEVLRAEDIEPFTWEALTRLEASVTDRLSGLAGSLSHVARDVSRALKCQPDIIAEDPQPCLTPLPAPALAAEGPIVSVVIAHRNESARIGGMLASLAAQSEPSFEVHLVDDGSDDGSDEIVNSFIRTDSRFVSWKNGEPRGPSVRRNQGLDAARGKYVYFADGDDTLSHDALARLLDTLLRTGADVVRGSHMFHFDNGARSANAFDQFHQPELDSVTYTAMPSLVFLYTAWNMLMSRDVILANGLRFDESLRLGEDRLFTQELFSISRSLSLTKHVTYRWIRAHDPARQLSLSRSAGARIAAVSAYLSLFDTLAGATARHRELAQAAMFWEVYRHLLENGRAAALGKPDRQSLARIIDMFDFPDTLLEDPSVKGWSEDAQSPARALYLRLRRARSRA